MRLYNFFLSRYQKKTSIPSTHGEEQWKINEDQTRKTLRLRHLSLNTEKNYLIWLRQFKGFVGAKSPQDLEGSDLQDFLTHLAAEKKVSSSTQSQALNAIVFFYRHVLNKNIENTIDAVRARHRRYLPVVMTVQEVEQVLGRMFGEHRLMAMLIYGCGLRITECLSLRIKE